MNKKLEEMTEEELRETEVITPKTIEELNEYINSLVNRQHDYGTCVYAMSMASVATFNYIAHKLGVTGFQAGCADLDILTRTRRMKDGFFILNYKNLLYPQYLNEDSFPSISTLLNKNAEHLGKRAKELLKESPMACPSVVEHWKLLAKNSCNKTRKEKKTE